MFTYTFFRPPYWSTKEVLRHGGSIPASIILRGTLIFRRISRLWDNARTLYLENRLLYLSSIISQFLGFVHRMVFYSVFNCVTMNTLYKKIYDWRPPPFYFIEAVPIECFVSHRPPSLEGGSVRSGQKKKGMNT